MQEFAEKSFKMPRLLKNTQNWSGLSSAYVLTVVWSCFWLSPLAFGQPSDEAGNLTSEVTTSKSRGHQPIEPIWGYSEHDSEAHDLPSYRMAKEAMVGESDYRQPLPIPSTQSATPTPSSTEEEIVPELDFVEPVHEDGTVWADEDTEELDDLTVGGQEEEFAKDFNLSLPTVVRWSSHQPWGRFELDTPDTFEEVFSSPLQRYEPLFHPNKSYTPSALTHPYGTVPLVLNRHVERNLDYFRVGIPERFQGYLDRYAKYKPLVEQIFREFGLPTELGYLSLVESGFNPRAYSRARASGPWQFMKATGRMYGLQVTWYVDERRDPVKSTIAAAHHLRDLYDQFGSWPLALGAYNAGGGKISRAIRRTGSRDFWKIRRTWYIRRETKEYVPRFIAATLIASHPTDYGFTAASVSPYTYDEVLIHKRVHLKAVAKTTGIALETLRELNPELRRSIVPTTKEGYPLKVPKGMGHAVHEQHDLIQPWTQPPPPPTTWYRVRYGDSLSVVARRFRMKVRTLKRLNGLSGNLIRVGQRLRVRASEGPVDYNARWYTVRRGDNLSGIAQRFGTTAHSLKRLNNLSGHLIHVGDKLRVRETAKAPKQPSGETKWYRVRRGDSLWKIAQRFRVSVTDLKILNNLTTSAIRAGKLLLISQ